MKSEIYGSKKELDPNGNEGQYATEGSNFGPYPGGKPPVENEAKFSEQARDSARA